MSNKSIKLNFLYNALFTGVNLLFPLISFQYTLHILGPIGIGKAQFAFSFAQYFTIVAAIGIPTYGVREVARCKNDYAKLSSLFSELIIINGITCLTLFIIYLIIINSFSYFETDKNLYLAGGTIIIFAFSAIEWFYSGLSDFRALAVRSLIIKSASLMLLFICVKSPNDYYCFFLLSIGSVLGGNLINILLIRHKVKFSFDNLNLRQHLIPLLLIFGISIGSSMYTVLDTVFLGFLTQPKIVGFYTCAVKFSKMFVPFITVLGTVLMPEISKKVTKNNLSEAQLLLEKSFEFIVFFSIPACFALFILAPEFISFFSGNKFTEAVTTMKILSVLPFLIGLGYFFASQILFPAGRYKEVLLSVLMGLAIFIILNFVLVPQLLHNGAAIANVISELVVTLCYLVYIKKNYVINVNLYSILKTIICCMLFFPIVYLIRLFYLPLTLSIAVSAITCVAVYILIQWWVFKNEIVNNLYWFIAAGFKQSMSKLYK